jgi:hypothetical protein
MAARSWAGTTVTAIGVAAGAGAAQLGVGYGLGIITWLSALPPQQQSDARIAWLASLAWVVWVAASSTVLGAVVAHSLAGRGEGSDRSGLFVSTWRVTLALAAAVGALVTVPLVAVPARAAESEQNFAPEWTAAGYVVVGVCLGLVLAIAALSSRAIAANVVGSVAYLWLLAVLGVAGALRQGGRPPLAQLAIWEFSTGPRVRGFYVPGVLLMLATAFVIGLLAAWPAARRGDNRVGVAISGAAGPLLVAGAYLLAAPQFAGEPHVDVSQWSAYLFAPYAVIAGLAGSVLAAAVGPPQPRAPKAPETPAAPEPAEPAEVTRDLAATPDPADDQLREWPDTLKAAGTPGPGPGTSSTSGTSTATATATRPAPAPERRRLRKEPDAPVDKPEAEPKAADEPRHPDADLEADAYAPSRAYGTSDAEKKAYATDTVEAEPAKPATPSARTEPRAPLWPTDPPEQGKGRRPKR